MDADSEGHVPVALAVEVHLVCVLEVVGVVVGTREVHEDLVTLAERHAAVLDVFPGIAGHGDRGVEAEQLLDGGVPQAVVGVGHASPVVAVAREVPEGRADGTPGGVDPGHELQVAHSDHHLVGQRLALVLGLAEGRDEVVLRVGPPVGHLGGEEAPDDVAVLGPQLGLLEAQLQHTAHPLDELVDHPVIDAQLLGDDAGRDLLGVVDRSVAPALVDEAVDQLVAEPFGVGAVVGDALGGEVGEQGAAGPTLLRRVCADRGGRVVARGVILGERLRHVDHDG